MVVKFFKKQIFLNMSRWLYFPNTTFLFSVTNLADTCIMVNAHDVKKLQRSASQQKFMVHLEDFTEQKTIRNVLGHVKNMGNCVAVVIDVATNIKHHIDYVKRFSSLPVIVQHISGRHDALMCCAYDVQGLVVAEHALLAEDRGYSVIVFKFL